MLPLCWSSPSSSAPPARSILQSFDFLTYVVNRSVLLLRSSLRLLEIDQRSKRGNVRLLTLAYSASFTTHLKCSSSTLCMSNLQQIHVPEPKSYRPLHREGAPKSRRHGRQHLLRALVELDQLRIHGYKNTEGSRDGEKYAPQNSSIDEPHRGTTLQV